MSTRGLNSWVLRRRQKGATAIEEVVAAGDATCALVLLALIFEEVPQIEWSARLLVLLLYGGAVGIALPYWAMQTVNRSLPAITTALGLLAVPIVGVACSSIALGEPLTVALVAAAALIISGIAIGLSDSIVRLYRS